MGEYYYLKLTDSVNYELKIEMYGNQKLYGKYYTHNDTLVFETYNFIDENKYLSEREKNTIINRFGKYLIKDSLLIPICFYEMEIPPIKRYERDSNLVEIYVLSDGHAYFILELKSDSIF
ncbi:hypothetical protein KKB18_08305 [bacterium]|nr:hypothetical protein [bacterium]